jgi:hypothetical protein
MKKLIPIIIVVGVVLLGGIYFIANSQRGNNQDHIGHTGNQSETQSHRSYEIDVTQKPQPNQITLNEPTTIKYRIKDDKGEILKDFTIAHEKLMHFIVVRNDLTQFDHLHPDYNEATGEFSVDVVFTVDGPYRFFADFTPGIENFDKLPVTVYSDLTVGDLSNFQPHAITTDTNRQKVVPPNYQVDYMLPNQLQSQTPITYSLTVTQNGQPVTLEKYLGALGHSVVLKENTLEYIHTHAGDQTETNGQGHDAHSMPTEQSPNRIDFSTTFPEAGTYKIFTQFQHQGNVLTTDYVVEVN